MTPHNEAKKGDYHKTVLMPGDPLRAKFIADTFLDDAVCVNTVRNCFGYSGTYKGQPVSVQASGMGQPSLSIYVHELFTFYDVQNIIRVGSCGGISKQVSVGDHVVAMSASTDSSMSNDMLQWFMFNPSCDYDLLRKYTNIDITAKVGHITSNDYFYQNDTDWFKKFIDYGVLAVDMETHMLYALAAKHGRSALSVNTVSDHLVYGSHMTSKERETGFSAMIENVLESLL